MSGKPIVAATDGSEESLRAVDWAAREAVLRGAPLRIVSAATLLPRMMDREDDGPDVGNVTDALLENRDRALAQAAERAARISADLLVDTDHLSGAPALAVTESGSGALLLVVGSRGTGAFTALVLGSVSRYAATRAAALSFAFEEASLRRASLLAVHAWNTAPSGTARLYEALATPGTRAIQERLARKLAVLLVDWQAKYPDVPISQDVVSGHPGRALAGLSARADLVVIGRHPGPHGPGAVTHAVLNHAHGPVVTVPSA
jgi:nucleotide-binding universal stress UspA family protein